MFPRQSCGLNENRHLGCLSQVAMKARIEDLEGIHRSPPVAQVVGNRPVRHRLVRIHPETGKRALYMRPVEDMDSDTGPVVGMQPGPHGAGAMLLNELAAHATQVGLLPARTSSGKLY